VLRRRGRRRPTPASRASSSSACDSSPCRGGSSWCRAPCRAGRSSPCADRPLRGGRGRRPRDRPRGRP
jgi:hypothetical protein